MPKPVPSSVLSVACGSPPTEQPEPAAETVVDRCLRWARHRLFDAFFGKRCSNDLLAISHEDVLVGVGGI